MENIDFVILWVDGNDSNWLEEKNKFLPNSKESNTSTANNRYRDWNILKYWFRGVEQYADWVHRIYFVTWGHVPNWLNLRNEKICVVNHKDFIPEKYLPTFNSNAIILNLHKIKNLSENFVLFNDDMFILDKVKPSDFFENNMPKDSFSFNLISPTGNSNDSFNHMKINNINLINRYYKKSDVIKKNFFKIYNIKNGLSDNIKTLFLTPWSRITGFVDPHIPYSYKKSYFKKIWEKEHEVLNLTCSNKFRSNSDITDWVIRYMQLCDGNFINRKSSFGMYYEINNSNEKLINHIIKQKSKLICINDVINVDDVEEITDSLIKGFEKILPNKSNFEV